MVEGVEWFVREILGSADPAERSWMELLHKEFPLLFVIASGAEPTQELRSLSAKAGAQLMEISIGSENTHHALEQIQLAAQNGTPLP